MDRKERNGHSEFEKRKCGAVVRSQRYATVQSWSPRSRLRNGVLSGAAGLLRKKIGKEEGLRCGNDQSTHVLSAPKFRPSIASPMVVFRASRRTTPAASRKFG